MGDRLGHPKAGVKKLANVRKRKAHLLITNDLRMHIFGIFIFFTPSMGFGQGNVPLGD
jgi:hypothetical protein